MTGEKREDFNQIKIDLISEIKVMNQEIKGMRQDMDRLFKTVEFHDQALYGDKLDKPGAMEDVRGIKTYISTRQKHAFAMWLAIIPIILERVWSHLIGHGPK